MKKIKTFFSEVKTQFGKITWPTRDTLIQLSVVVIFISFLVALILGLFDYAFTQSIAWLTSTK